MVAFIYSMVDSVSSSNISILLQVISSWGVQNKIDFLSLSYTRHAEDVREVTWKMKINTLCFPGNLHFYD